MQTDVAARCAVAAAAGVATHVFYFNRAEHHMYGISYVMTYLVTSTAAVAYFVNFHNIAFGPAIFWVSVVGCSYLLGIFGSLLIYRIFLNPLNRFPGPFGACISSFYTSAKVAKNLDAYHHFQSLHKKYGRYVRVGSNELSIIDPDAVEIAYGVGSKTTKSQWYDGDYPFISMHTSRDKALHDRRRRIWSPAFSEKALKGYEGHITAFNDKIVQKFKEFAGGPTNASKWFNLYSFDVMNELAFGTDYGMLASGERHWALDLLSDGMKPVGMLPPVWFFRMVAQIPGLAAGYHRFVKFCGNELDKRVQRKGAASTDIMSWLLKGYESTDIDPSKDVLLQGDARLIIVAGSDTTAATLTFLFYHLALDPSQTRKLREELKPLTAGGDWTHRDIQNASHLNGVINEALRLHPPVPNGVSRKTPPQGMQVGETYVPGNALFVMPQFTMGRGKSVRQDRPGC